MNKIPFKSKSQARYMFSQHPGMAKEWAAKTDFSNLPEHADSELGLGDEIRRQEQSKEKRDNAAVEAQYNKWEAARPRQKKITEFAAGGKKMENPTTGPYNPNNIGPSEFNQVIQNSQSKPGVQGNNASTEDLNLCNRQHNQLRRKG